MTESPDSTPTANEAPRFCSECGAPLLPEAAICAECGSPVEKAVNLSSPIVADPPHPVSEVVSTLPNVVSSGERSPKKRLVIVGGAIGLIILTVAGYLVVQHFSGDDGYIHDEGFPVTFSEETLSHYSTPAQLVYFHVISEFYRGSDGTLTVGSPQITDSQVDIRLKFDKTWENWRFVETENDGKHATVAVGLADAGAYEYYNLEKRRGNWVITGALGAGDF